MRVRLIRKFADLMDGIDLSRRKAGDVVELPDRQAAILIAEGWAKAAPPSRGRESRRTANDSQTAAWKKKKP